ncbi:hypothetical protein RN001_002669 [Aquatica leii]|uniref:Uncharacterized protein n=1 Tax=Aquatica leii TaxID=1421715 RepID=A0AAN7QNM8_9COLE|nr:hypothetical protein RN001_002669 [Aquatica leii]
MYKKISKLQDERSAVYTNLLLNLMDCINESSCSYQESPNGQMLVSHSGEPDYTLTIFDWSTSTILFTSLSNAYVYKIIFSVFNHNYFTSFGPNYIKFWKISKTFTGLKLEEQEGKFNQTNMCNILCAYIMPNDMVLSGCEWGNILVWKNGYIHVEIERKLNKKCHNAPITQLFFKNNELWSISMDGQIKLWYYPKIDIKKLLDNDLLVSVEPIYKFNMPRIMFLGIYQQDDSNNFFVQDGNGGLWDIDLNTKTNPKPPEQLYKCHGGAVADIAVYPWSNYLFSLGVDGRLQIYNYEKHEFLYSFQHPAKGSCLLYLPISVQSSGDLLIIGFDDGNLRVVVVDVETTIACTTIQIIKPHSLPIRKIALNKSTKVLVSASEDCTIFVHYLQCSEFEYATVVPIGYVRLPEVANCLLWNSCYNNTLLVGAENGYYATIDIPTETQSYTEHTFLLHEQPLQHFLVHDQTNKKLTNKILWIMIVNDNTWFSMDKCDRGLIYKFNEKRKRDSCYRCDVIYNANGILINNCILSHNKVILAMGDGSIVIANQVEFSDCYRILLHDNYNSFIPKMCFSKDKKYLFSCGYDGNIFSHRVNSRTIRSVSYVKKNLRFAEKVDDYNSYTNFTLEECKIRKKADEQSKLAVVRKQSLTTQLKELKAQFQFLMNRNDALPESQRLSRQELEIHPLITKYFNEEIKRQLELVKAQLSHKVEKSRIIMEKSKKHFTDPLDFFPFTVRAIQDKVAVTIINQKKLTKKFYDTLCKVEKTIQETDLLEQWRDDIKFSKHAPIIVNTTMPKKSYKKHDALLSLSMQELKYGRKINQLLNRYKARKLKLQKRKKEWDDFKSIKPVNVNSTEDENALTAAKESIGDYVLKSSSHYKVSTSCQMTVSKKYHQLLLSRLKKFNIIHEYNQKVCQIRTRRTQAIQKLKIFTNKLQNIHEELPEKYRKFPPNMSLVEDDFPETNLEVVVIPLNQTNTTIKKEIIPNKDLLEKEVLLENVNPDDDSEWEMEARNHRKNRKIFEQDVILNKIKNDIITFDKDMATLAKEGNEVMRDVDLLDLHIITLNHELIILKDYEPSEKNVSKEIHSKITLLYQIHNLIENNRFEIKNILKKIQNLHQDETSLRKLFRATVQSSTQYQYLKKIFKGKENDIFSSSESSKEGDNVQTLNECDQGLYETTLEFHKQRLSIYENIKKLKNNINQLNTEIKNRYEKAKKIEYKIKELRIVFDKLQIKKQNQLNNVMCTVVLKLHQLQHLDARNTPSNVADTLIFSQTILCNLYKKVGQLHNETELEKTKHKTYFAHICRMKTDYHLMKEQIKKLQNQIEDSCKKKMGTVEKVDVIEEARLKQKLFEFKLSQTNVKSSFERHLRKWNENLKAKKIEIKETIKKNTTKVNVLTTLNKEKAELIKILGKQNAEQQHLERVVVVAETCRKSIEKLSEIVKNQNQNIEVLQNEIKRLNYKTVPSSSSKLPDEMLSIRLDTDSARRSLFRFNVWDYKEKQEFVHKKEELPIVSPLNVTEVQIPLV